jgi:hypothetical protein
MKPIVFIWRFAPELIAALVGISLAYIHGDLDWFWLSAYALFALQLVTRWLSAQWRRIKTRPGRTGMLRG